MQQLVGMINLSDQVNVNGLDCSDPHALADTVLCVLCCACQNAVGGSTG